MSKRNSNQLSIAVLLTFEAQLLDMAGIDIFGMMAKEYVAYMPPPLQEMALDLKVYYVGRDSSSSPSIRPLTAQAAIQADVSVDANVVQPGEIDILMIPGPPPGQPQSRQTLDFVRAHHKYGTTILTVCTGCYVAAQAGILDGRKASAPRDLVPILRKEYPATNWDDERRYVKDIKTADGIHRELWSSGAICNGLEMIAAYLKEKYPGQLSETVCAMAAVGDKGEFYDSTVVVNKA